MRTIWKFKIDTMAEETAITAKVYKWLNMAEDPLGNLCVWAIVDPNATAAQMSEYIITRIGTGWGISDNINLKTYLGSVNDDPYVWHYFITEVNNFENNGNWS